MKVICISDIFKQEPFLNQFPIPTIGDECTVTGGLTDDGVYYYILAEYSHPWPEAEFSFASIYFVEITEVTEEIEHKIKEPQLV